jgi:hypothetical protein
LSRLGPSCLLAEGFVTCVDDPPRGRNWLSVYFRVFCGLNRRFQRRCALFDNSERRFATGFPESWALFFHQLPENRRDSSGFDVPGALKRMGGLPGVANRRCQNKLTSRKACCKPALQLCSLAPHYLCCPVFSRKPRPTSKNGSGENWRHCRCKLTRRSEIRGVSGAALPALSPDRP